MGAGDHEILELCLMCNQEGWLGRVQFLKAKIFSELFEILSLQPPWDHVTVLLIERGMTLKGRGDEDKLS